MEKTYLGNHESEESGWSLLGYVGEDDGVRWAVYRKPQPSGQEWDYIKVVADGKVPKKANYWLSWNGSRFGSGGDFLKMAQHRRELCSMVLSFMDG